MDILGLGNRKRVTHTEKERERASLNGKVTPQITEFEILLEELLF